MKCEGKMGLNRRLEEAAFLVGGAKASKGLRASSRTQRIARPLLRLPPLDPGAIIHSCWCTRMFGDG